MRHSRYARHRRHMRYERHGDDIQTKLNGPLTASIPATRSVATGAALSIASTVSGGFAPYKYVWKRAGTVVAGQTGKTLTIAAAAAANAGSYTCEVTDAKATKKVTNACVVTVTA